MDTLTALLHAGRCDLALVYAAAKTSQLPKSKWFKHLPPEAQQAWQTFEKTLDHAGIKYLEQSDQRGGAVLLAHDPPDAEGIAVHLFAPGDRAGKLTVWDQDGQTTTVPFDSWKKALPKLRRSLGLQVERKPFSLKTLMRRLAAERRDVIAALLRADRPDLANAVAAVRARA